MADKIKYGISVTPIEELTDENSGSHNIIASEVNKSLGCSGEAIVTDFSGIGTVQGYENGDVFYKRAPTGITIALSEEATASFVFIKNTGYRYSTTSSLGDLEADDSILVTAGGVTISILDAGEAIVLKDDNAGIDCTNITISTVYNTGQPYEEGSPALAVEYLVVD